MGFDARQNQIALLNAEISAVDSELDIMYKEKLSELESRAEQPYQPDMEHPNKVVQKGNGGAEAKAMAEEYMRTYKPAMDLAASRAELIRQRDALIGPRANLGIRWFRRAALPKMIKSPKPARVPRAPTSPKTPAAKKPKKIVGPKSPTGFKKKLYIPKKFIQAAYGGPGLDSSPAAVANLMRYMGDNNLRLSYVEWVNPSPSERCDKGICNELNGPMHIYDISELLKGIFGWSHDGCDCHIVVTLDNGETFKITTDDDLAHLQWVSAPRPETDVTPEDQVDYMTNLDEMSPQERYLGQEGFSYTEGETPPI